MPIRFKAVSAETKRLIDLGNEVIQICRAIVKMGAGNQEQTVRATQGRSSHLTWLVHHHPNYIWNKPLHSGGVSCGYGAGNCQDQAAITYTILRSKLTAEQTVSFCLNSVAKHSFATIGDPRTDPANEVICVDPWPLQPQALLLEHHSDTFGLEVLRSKKGAKALDFWDRLLRYAPSDALSVREAAETLTFNVESIIKGPGMFDRVYASSGGITWVYKVRATWIANDQRQVCHGCGMAFSRERLRRHCNSCGEIYCRACSSGQTTVGIPAAEPEAPVLEVTNGPVPVCATCLQKITADGFGG
jgi:hypothetical protein